MPVIVKNTLLILAHLQRQTHRLSPSLQSDVQSIISAGVKVTTVMVEMAAMHEGFASVQAMLDFRRRFLHAMDLKESPLMMIPHFSPELVANFVHLFLDFPVSHRIFPYGKQILCIHELQGPRPNHPRSPFPGPR